jgi:hypothetical protein
MLLLPLLLDAFGSIKFLHVVRDGRDGAIIKNQSPVQKFYDSYYLHGQEKQTTAPTGGPVRSRVHGDVRQGNAAVERLEYAGLGLVEVSRG